MKIIKKISKTLMIVALCLTIFALLYSVVFEIVNTIDATIAHSRIHKYGIALKDDYIYIDEDELSDAAPVEEALKNVPPNIIEEIQNNWIILVAETPPDGELKSSVIVGSTYSRAKTIWLAPDFTEETLVHEIGHAVASIECLDISQTFRNLYNIFWDKCYEWTTENHSSHDASTPVEFFALLFEQYILHPDELKTNFPEGYKYMDDVVTRVRATPLYPVTTMFTKNYHMFTYGMHRLGKSCISLFATTTIHVDVANNPTINSKDYTPNTTFGGLRTSEQEIFNTVFDIVKHPEKYMDSDATEANTIKIRVDEYISFATYNKVAACIDYYLGQEVSDVFDVTSFSGEDYSTIVVHVDTLTELQKQRNGYITNVHSVLEQLHEGTETQKLLQISKYIIDNCEYEIKDQTSANDFWSEHKGDCVTYAIVFRHFCEQLGIQCDIISGMTQDGEGHVWNRVKLSDGSYRYYDLTYAKIGGLNIEQYDRHVVLAMNSYVPQ